jgi:hypothetical protein
MEKLNGKLHSSWGIGILFFETLQRLIHLSGNRITHNTVEAIVCTIIGAVGLFWFDIDKLQDSVSSHKPSSRETDNEEHLISFDTEARPVLEAGMKIHQ